MDIYRLMALAVEQQASDIHFSSGNPPILRINGRLTRCCDEIILTELLQPQLLATLNSQQKHQFEQTGHVDYAIALSGIGRLRGNIFQQRAGISAVYRVIPQRIPDLVELQAPAILTQLIQQRDGLILITGATGSGKSTTLAALIQYLNQQRACHIITLEDPIEFIYSHSGLALIQQRELGLHTADFSSALRAALRQDPDVILLGELRDPDTIRLALTAAETGHLVLATLHTRSAIQSIERIIDVFPAEEKAFVRGQLSSSLQGVITQCLVMQKDGQRMAAFEILINTAAMRNLIREGKTHQMLSVLQTSQQHGMQTMQQAIARLASQPTATFTAEWPEHQRQA